LLSTIARPMGRRDNCMITFAPAGASANPLMSCRRTPGEVAESGALEDLLDSLVNELSIF
jgi:hypothetical protein